MDTLSDLRKISPGTPLYQLFASLLVNGIVPLAGGDEFLAQEARALSDELLQTNNGQARKDFAFRLEQLVKHMKWVGPEHMAVREALLDLLRLIVSNIRELVIDDNWLHGQLSAITETFSGPLNLRTLNNIGQQLREVIDIQSRLKHELNESQLRLKLMLAGFIDRLSEVSGTTGEYNELLVRSARRIGEASNIADLSEVVGELMLGTRQAQESTLRAGQELTELREQVDSSNREIARLQRELDMASQLMRHDALTGVLNRKGLAEALKREVSRMRRKDSCMCIALIDLDDFKRINDLYGHAVGDDVLCHLTRTVTGTLRPQDVVARYGGEEFIILLPDTPLDAAKAILTRLQHELTHHVFCVPNSSDPLLITFSAGVALLSPDGDPEATISQADQAMYAAKRAGKDRVFGPVPSEETSCS